jgi:ABC-type Fe3+ transport system permease subunit
LPTWHKYLDKTPVTDLKTGVVTACTPVIKHINDIWLIVAAILDLMLRLAALAAIAMVVYGGVQYIMSQDEPDKTKQARSTIINALIGLVIAVAATTLITFIAGRF